MLTEMTIQQAAEFLNVSQPYLVKLLESGDLPFHKSGEHYRVKSTDLIAYNVRCHEESERALAELAEQAQQLNMGYE